MRIHLLDEVHPVLVERLTAAGHACIAHDHPDAPVLDRCDGLVVRSRRVDMGVLDRAPGLRFVARVGSGLENIDTEACAARGVEVMNSPEGNRDGVAEHTLLLVLALLKHLPRADRQVHAGQWRREENRGTDLHGLTVGIIGLGHMGRAFAERLQGFGVRVMAHDKYRSGHAPAHVQECDLPTLQRESDIVSLHLPLNTETLHYAGARFLSGFAKPIRLVNTSRGPVVHTAALLDALDSGRVLAAGLDVLEFERPDLSGLDPGTEAPVLQRLLAHDRVILTPHIAGVTHEGRFKMAAVLADKILSRFPHAEP